MNRLSLWRSWFLTFFSFNLVFLVLQFAYVYSQSNTFIHSIPLPAITRHELIATLCLQPLLYLFLSALQTALFWAIMQRSSRFSTRGWLLVIWGLSIVALLASNGYFFPLSTFSHLFLPELPHMILVFFLLCPLLFLGMLFLNLFILCGQRSPMITTLVAILVFLASIYTPAEPSKASPDPEKPDIILIGVDSLPPAAISRQNTPAITDFIKQSVLFKETISPLARTYPAWSTILTGLYPRHHGARYNLMPQDQVKSGRSIAWRMQKSGYKTIFATDDRRFNNLGKEFGFQEIIGPKAGVNDILSGTFNDFPLSNLFINLPITRKFFPYNYMNRASHYSYYPQTFDHALQTRLAANDHSSPLFIAVHFTMAHWPYAFAASSPAQVKDEYSVTEREQLFSTALNQADQQVAHLLSTLQKYGYLENSLVVLLSDHGETLYTPGSRQTMSNAYQGNAQSRLENFFKHKTSTAQDKSAGHGSDLLSTDQYHCVLAGKIYKNGVVITKPGVINTRVALIDIAPTVKEFSKIMDNQHVDGISLLTNLLDHQHHLPERAFIMESGMMPNQFLSREKARQLGQQLFTIDKTNGLLHIKKSKLATLDSMKLYAVITGNWVFALYPDDDGYLPVTQRLNDGAWTDELNSDFAKSSPAREMLENMRHFYGKPFTISGEQIAFSHP